MTYGEGADSVGAEGVADGGTAGASAESWCGGKVAASKYSGDPASGCGVSGDVNASLAEAAY